MNRKYFSLKSMSMIATALLLSLLTSCEKDTEPTNFAPTVVTGSAENIYRLGATISGTIENPNGYYIQDGGVEYSEFQSFAEPKQATATIENGLTNFSIPITGLEPGTTYYYRTFAYSGYNTVYGQAKNFKTEDETKPKFGATTVSNISYTSFDVTAELLDNGGTDLFLWEFIYKKVENENDTELTRETDGYETIRCKEDFTTSVKDLNAGTLYAIRPAGGAKGIGYGEIAYVRTLSTDRTLLSSCVLSDTIGNSIKVSASVLSAGTYPIVEYGFCYNRDGIIPDINHLSSVATANGTSFSATLNNLASQNTYRIRAYVKNNQGEVIYSEEITDYTVIEHNALVVTTLPADEITINSATLHGNVSVTDKTKIAEQGFCWSETNVQPDTLANRLSVNILVNTDDYDATIAVKFGTNYYYRAYAINKDREVFYGEVMQFTATDINTPTLTVEEATNITETSANVSASLTDNGGSEISEQGFCWSTETQMPTISNFTKTTDASSFNALLDNLKPGTTYYFRAYAKNEKGFGYSEVKQFTTSISYAPTLSETVVSDITLTSAKAAASITNNGGAEITERGFCISTTNQAPTTADRKMTVATEMDMFTTDVDQLTEGTTYYIRAYATNKNGTSYGKTATFTTVGIALPTVVANAATDITETSVTLTGAVTDNGNGTITEWGFCISTTNSQPTVEDSHILNNKTRTRAQDVELDNIDDWKSFTMTPIGLTRNTKYYFRAYAINEKGVAYSEVKEFTTAYIVTPAILSAVTVTNIAQTTLTATATLTDDGRGIISEMGFCYVAGTGTPTVNDTKLTVPTEGTTLTRDFSSLTPGTSYTIRAYAVNENGTSYSEPVTITTKKNDPSEDDAEFPGVN